MASLFARTTLLFILKSPEFGDQALESLVGRGALSLAGATAFRTDSHRSIVRNQIALWFFCRFVPTSRPVAGGVG
jgi:hypothetical protein